MTATGYDLATELDLFVRMARTYPVRTLIFTFGLPLFGLAQLITGVVTGSALLPVVLFFGLAVTFSLILTRYQIAVFGRRTALARVQGTDGTH